jgi:phosphoribosylformylglycinamidine synthase
MAAVRSPVFLRHRFPKIRLWEIMEDVNSDRMESAVAQTYQAKIYVTLRPSVLDPAGTAVRSGVRQMGYENVEQIRIGKYIETTLKAENEDEARRELDEICDRILANPVIETYRFDLTPVSETATTAAS